jgi:ribosome-binding protein aMBF1 (putative translation factor)
MSSVATPSPAVAKKKSVSGEKPKQYGTLIRVSESFADAIRKASQFQGMSMAGYADEYLLPVVEKKYRDAVLKEAERMKSKGEN